MNAWNTINNNHCILRNPRYQRHFINFAGNITYPDYYFKMIKKQVDIKAALFLMLMIKQIYESQQTFPTKFGVHIEGERR